MKPAVRVKMRTKAVGAGKARTVTKDEGTREDEPHLAKRLVRQATLPEEGDDALHVVERAVAVGPGDFAARAVVRGLVFAERDG